MDDMPWCCAWCADDCSDDLNCVKCGAYCCDDSCLIRHLEEHEEEDDE